MGHVYFSKKENKIKTHKMNIWTTPFYPVNRPDSFIGIMKKYEKIEQANLFLLPDHLHPSHPQDEDENRDNEEFPLNPGPIGVDK